MPDFATRSKSGDTIDLNLHPGQIKAWNSTAQCILVLAGTQGGKTSFEPIWQHREVCKVPPHVEIDHLAASATYDMMDLKMLPEYQKYFCEMLGWGTYKAGQRCIVSANGKQRIIFRTAESAGGLESATAFSAVLDEWGLDTVPITRFEAVQRRLSLATGEGGGRILIGTTPYCENWLKLLVYDRWIGGDTHYDVVQFRSIDNPRFPREEYDRMKNTLPEWKFRMMYDGMFTRPAGLIYTDYEDSYAEFDDNGKYSTGGNLVKAFSIPATWLRDLGVDFGESANCARIWLAEDPRTHYAYVYRDSLGGGLNGPEYAREALEYKEPIRQALGGARSEDERRLQWARAGLPVQEPFIQDVEGGIDHGNALFKQRRVFVFDTCNRFRSELGTYSRELDAAGEPTAKISNKDTFHMLDAYRYVGSRYPLDAPAFTVPKVEVDVRGRTKRSIDARNAQFRVKETGEYR